MVISPHPDDESFGCGGTLALMARRGVLLHITFVTDGSASHPGHPLVTPADIAGRRHAEANKAAAILGIGPGNVTFLKAPDGELDRLTGQPLQDVLDGIAGLLSQLRPEAILLPCRGDGSSEHDAAFRLVRRVLDNSDVRPRILEFPVWSWWNPILILRSMFAYKHVWRVELGDARDVKALAMASYVSQSLPIPPETTSALPPGFASMFLGKEEFLFEK